MSSISSIGGGAQSIYQFIQALAGTTQSQPTTSTSSTSGASSDPTQTLGQVLQSGGHHHHHHGGGAAFKQIQDAVTSALQSAQSSGSASDPNKIIEDAISQVLKNNNGSASASAPSGTAQPTGSDPAATGPAASTGTTAQQSFFSTLQSLGVSPKQFQQDFLAAVKDAQGGQVNLATAFQSMPLGTTVDTIA